MKTPSNLANPVPSDAARLSSTARDTWEVDPGESVARFTAATLWGLRTVRGELGEVNGTLEWSRAVGRGQMAIAVSGISSGITMRDHHLRKSDFFDVANHPEIRFDATEVVAVGDKVELRGELLVRGGRYPFACIATIKRLGNDRIALQTSATFDLDHLGMSRGLLRMLPAGVTADVRVVLRRIS